MRSLLNILLVLACAPVTLAQIPENNKPDSALIQQLETSWLSAERTTDAALLIGSWQTISLESAPTDRPPARLSC